MKKEYRIPLLTEVNLDIEDILSVSITKEETLEWGGEADEIF